MIKHHYKNLIIGFGKGGKTLAAYFASQQEEVAIIEKSNRMYGGTCINIGCIPSKSLITNADAGTPYKTSHEIKENLVTDLRKKNYKKLADTHYATIIDGEASFISPKKVKVQMAQQEVILTADRIFINTGASPSIPDIKGIDGKNIYNSTTLMDIRERPEHLTIIGGGFIGLEFADMFLKFGSKVTLLESAAVFLPHEDRDVADAIHGHLVKNGLQLIAEATVVQFDTQTNQTIVTYKKDHLEESFPTDAVLIATGRTPETKGLNLEAAGIATDERGYIKVNDRLQTTAENIWALGDVNGSPQFTYISLDDFRIIKNQLSAGPYNSTDKRLLYPTAVFLSLPYARIGLNEKTATEKGLHFKTFRIKAAGIPKAAILQQKDGILKAIVDIPTGKILGCTLFCAEAHELINIVQLAINNALSYKTLRDNIYTHPSMAESFNDLFSE
ncbi:FAD-dependent oxidoreductase [Chitinophaga flava]|uniref:Pyridine nucleotide-disulfide oxidoreductase n=1 Tax=Chitinophaga flava TaxID=2259036 RepID=A0A365Y2Z6_9BACT|nr:FAD-dependent oxidoreductase [Chitinophaga flava]RBL92678.1 pyridine nucleotide-disulfide oxidoreductase [Chitinophaga flava]